MGVGGCRGGVVCGGGGEGVSWDVGVGCIFHVACSMLRCVVCCVSFVVCGVSCVV